MNKVKVLHCFGTLNVGGAETLIFNIQKRSNKENGANYRRKLFLC